MLDEVSKDLISWQVNLKVAMPWLELGAGYMSDFFFNVVVVPIGGSSI